MTHSNPNRKFSEKPSDIFTAFQPTEQLLQLVVVTVFKDYPAPSSYFCSEAPYNKSFEHLSSPSLLVSCRSQSFLVGTYCTLSWLLKCVVMWQPKDGSFRPWSSLDLPHLRHRKSSCYTGEHLSCVTPQAQELKRDQSF